MARMRYRQAALLGLMLNALATATGSAETAHDGKPKPKTPSQWPRTTHDTKSSPIPAWTKSEIDIERSRCNAMLANVDIVAVPADAIREADCGTPAPVELISLGKKASITLSTPVVMTCDMAIALHAWTKGELQAAAREHLGSPIVKLDIMSGYSCRNAYGRKRTRMSEHGRANAVDIRAFVTQSGETVEVLTDWGPTERDIKARTAAAAAAAKAEAAKIEAMKREAERAQAEIDANRPKGAEARRSEASNRDMAAPGLRGSIGLTLPPPVLSMTPARLGGPHAPGDAAHIKTPPPPTTNKQRFLRRAHTAACKIFGTILGPEANEAHRNHFHVDMADRTTGNFCE